MSIFDNNTESELEKAERLVAELRAELESKKTKSSEAVRVGLHSTDEPRTFAEWMQYKRKVGNQVYRSRKVQSQLERDFTILGRDKFFGED
jgi:hypothetical protein